MSGNLVSKTLGGLYNGVSQQAKAMRLETQHTEMVNFDATLVDGLFKRPGTRWTAKMISELDTTGAFWGHINRDSDESYIYVISTAGYIYVWNKYGIQKTVVYGQMDFTDNSYAADNSVRTNYLASQTESAYLLFDTLTVADYTFISRSDITPAMTDDVSTGSGDYTSTETVTTTAYSVPTEGTTTTTTTDDDGTVTVTVVTVEITNTVDGDSSTRYTVDTTTTTTTTTPGGVTGEYQSFSDLEDAVQDEDYVPSTGDIVHINGDPDESDDEYWIRYTSDEVWLECCCPGEYTTIDADTMPHALVRAEDGVFVFTPLSWGERQVGCDSTNPQPSFIGGSIKHMFFYRNRLGFLTATSFVMSRPGDYFELFSLTSLDVLDSDPIDESANTRQVTNLHKTDVLGRKLILYSDRQQFTVHSNDDAMTPSTIQIDPGTTYETDEYSQTVTCGASCFFITPKNKWVDLMEFEDILNDDMQAASTSSSHCPQYIPNGFIQILSAPAQNMLIMHSDADPNSLWIYRYKTVDGTRAQSAFFEWRFHDDIKTMALIDGDLVLVQVMENGLSLVSISLGATEDDNFDWNIRLDRTDKYTSTGYDADAGTATISLPWPSDHTDLVVIDATYGRAVLNWESNGDYTIELSGVSGTGDYYVGLSIDAWVVLSPWYVKTSKGTAIIDGRLQVRNMTIEYTDTGYFKVTVENEGRDARSDGWTNNIIGKMSYGTTQLFDGEHKVGIRGRNTTTSITISSGSYLPVKISAISYEGLLTQRAQAL